MIGKNARGEPIEIIDESSDEEKNKPVKKMRAVTRTDQTKNSSNKGKQPQKYEEKETQEMEDVRLTNSEDQHVDQKIQKDKENDQQLIDFEDEEHFPDDQQDTNHKDDSDDLPNDDDEDIEEELEENKQVIE